MSEGSRSVKPSAERHWRLLFSAALLALVGLGVSLSAGKILLSPLAILDPSASGITASPEIVGKIVWVLRAPRAIGAALIGLSLAVSGLMLQSYFRNPLADPYILGVSSGAALGAVIKLLLLPDAPIPLSIAALLGAAVLIIVVWALSRSIEGDLTITLLLAGVAMSILAGSLMSVLILWGRPGDLGLVLRWLMGSLAGVGWREVGWLSASALTGVFIAYRWRVELNALQLGEVVASSIGVNVRAVRLWVIGGATLLAAVSVAAAGLIGFIGLVVPHMARLITGGDVRRLLPGAALLGAAVMVWCDLFSRTLLPTGELPVGAVTAIVGVPFFFWLMGRGRFFQ